MVLKSEQQTKILDLLLGVPDGETLDKIAEQLTVTRTAAKGHLIQLETSGLISSRDERRAVGRPRKIYFLTDEGQEVFPRKYSWLATELISFVANDHGEETLKALMQRLAIDVAGRMKSKLDGLSSKERFEKMTQILNDLGYRAQLKQSDIRKGAVIEAVNCVYHGVAKTHPSVCQFDIKFIEVTSGAKNVELECCIAKGAKVCRFRISGGS